MVFVEEFVQTLAYHDQFPIGQTFASGESI